MVSVFSFSSWVSNHLFDMRPATTLRLNCKLTYNLHWSFNWNYRVCLTACVPRSPAGIHAVVLQGQVGQVEMWVETLLSHNFFTVFEQNHLMKWGCPSDMTRDHQCLPHQAGTGWDIQDSPSSCTEITNKSSHHLIFCGHMYSHL